jgi:hypothetical protein
MEYAAKTDTTAIAMDSIRAGDSYTDFQAKALQVVRQRQAGGYLVRALEALTANPHGPPRFDDETGATVQRWAAEAAIDDIGPRSIVAPFTELARMAHVLRDLNTSDAGAGGFLVSQESRIVDALRPFSVTAQAGVTLVPNVRANQVLPTPLTGATISWADSGGSASTPTLAAAAGAAKIGFGVVNISRKLRLQSDAEAFTAAELLRVAGRAIDGAVLGGTGVEGQPTGIASASDVNTATGASITFAAITNAKRDATANGAPGGAWVSTPAVRALLEQREAVANTGVFVWKDDRRASWPAYATPDSRAATLIGGYWPSCFVLLYGAGVVIEANPFDATLYRQGVVQLRVAIQIDVLLPIPSAFTVASSVT